MEVSVLGDSMVDRYTKRTGVHSGEKGWAKENTQVWDHSVSNLKY